MPASVFPLVAKSKGAKIVEINIQESKYTHTVTDVFIRDKATVAMRTLCDLLCPHQ
jgi:NAD-dependent deacetylase